MADVKDYRDYSIAALTDKGSVREVNEDYYGILVPHTEEILDELGSLIIVSDGMGGHFSGGEASHAAVDVVSEVYFERSEGDPITRLAEAFQEANRQVFETVGKGLKSFAGTTCTAALLFPDKIHIAHAGDSRAYLIRGCVIEQVTSDHSVVGEMVRKGMLSKEDARHHPRRNVITRAIGLRMQIDVDVSESIPVETGDIVLVCTDGLSSMLDEGEIARIASENVPKDACHELVKRAKEEGGDDNITVVIALKN